MAFNPFHQFRRYSKTVFAALAILCMFTFVLSTGLGGKGDFFTTMTEMVTQRRRTQPVLTLYGKEYDALQVNEVQQRRMLASDYMEMAVGTAQGVLNDRAMKGFNKLDPNAQRMVQNIIFDRFNYQYSNQLGYYIQTENFARNWSLLSFLYSQAVGQKDKNPDAVDTLAALRGVLSLDLSRYAGRRPEDLYFGGSVRSTEDTLDFLLWLHQADQLGIKLSDDDIAGAIAADTLNDPSAPTLTKASAVQIDRELREKYKIGYSKEALYSALGDELRARMAQVSISGSTITGGMRTHTATPVFQTPEQYWEFFKDARTAVKVGLIDLPTDSFVSQVTALPSDDDLKKLFDKYKNVEAAPERAEPGFREPRRVQVEWVGATADQPYYQKAGDVLGAVLPGLRLLGNMNTETALVTPLALDAALLEQEVDFRRREIPWTDNYSPTLHATSHWRPENIAALVGSAIGAPNTGGMTLSGPLTFETASLVREVRDRVEFGGSMILTAALDPAPLGVLALPMESIPQVRLPLIQGMLKDKAREALISGSSYLTADSGLMKSDLLTFRTEVTKKGAESDRTVVRKYIDDFVKERGLSHGTTAAPDDQYALVNDLGMAPLREVYQRNQGKKDVLLRGFANDFFADKDLQTNAPIGLFTPRKFITESQPLDSDKQTYLFWRTEDVASRTQTFQKARPEVVEAWKLQQARDLAKKAADRLNDLAKQDQGDPQKLRDLAAREGGREFFELGPMARKAPVPNAMAGYGQQYQDPSIPADKIAYPGNEMLLGLLEMRNDTKGKTKVLADLPQKHFFVASLLQRDEPTMDEFRKVYANSMARATETDTLLAELARDRLIQYRKDVLKQLRTEANAVINEDARKRSGNEPTNDQ